MISIQERLIKNCNRPERPLTELKAIIVHWTANTGRGAGAAAHRNYFNRKPCILPNGRTDYSSAHYFVDDRAIIRCIPDEEVAFHCGAKWERYKDAAHGLMNSGPDVKKKDSPNYYTIGIEMCVNSDSDFSITRQNTIDLVGHLLQIHDLSPKDVLRHYDITGKDCPRMMLEDHIWSSFLDEVAGREVVAANGIKVNTAVLNVRKGPGTNFPMVRRVFNGNILEKIGQSQAWYQIGNEEWVHSFYVIPV